MTVALALENGVVFSGDHFGAEGETSGEVVFNTSMTGYQEILTDPSYAGQIVTMTYPLIGNYGVNDDDVEAAVSPAAGLIVRELSKIYSNWRSNGSLADHLKKHGIIGIEGIDTRMLTKIIRTQGALRGVLSTIESDEARLIEKARNIPSMAGLDLASKVTCKNKYCWDAVNAPPFALPLAGKNIIHDSRRFSVVVFDFGVKQNILRRLASYGCGLTIVPASTPAVDVLRMNPDGIFLSNGPGDPEAVVYAIETLKIIIGKKPLFGICLGHQLLALALGGKTYKLKYGHRGGNHPVKNLLTGAIEITSQNHGFAVDWESMDQNSVELTHINLNDKTVEGFRHRSLPLFSVQYHPEASPGPHDSDYLFGEFVKMMDHTLPSL